MKKIIVSALMGSIVLSGCAANTDDLGADVYDSTKLNQKQDTKMVDIIAILPAKVAIDNSRNKENAQVAGAIVGGILGAIVGHQFGSSGGYAGAGLGAVAGATAGSGAKEKTLVEGVSLTYKEDTKLLTSTQVGKKCQFKPGLALLITTRHNETRIQPNAECPKDNVQKLTRGTPNATF